MRSASGVLFLLAHRFRDHLLSHSKPRQPLAFLQTCLLRPPTPRLSTSSQPNTFPVPRFSRIIAGRSPMSMKSKFTFLIPQKFAFKSVHESHIAFPTRTVEFSHIACRKCSATDRFEFCLLPALHDDAAKLNRNGPFFHLYRPSMLNVHKLKRN